MMLAVFIASSPLVSSSEVPEPAIAKDGYVGALGRSASWFAGTSWRHQLEVGVRLSFRAPDAPPLAGVGGLRLAPGARVKVPAEAFLRLELTGRIGEYLEPACGIEGAVGGLTQPDAPPAGMPAGAAGLESARVGGAGNPSMVASPLRGIFNISIVASPLRLRFGRLRFVVADFFFGSSLDGSVAIFGIGYAKVEVRL